MKKVVIVIVACVMALGIVQSCDTNKDEEFYQDFEQVDPDEVEDPGDRGNN